MTVFGRPQLKDHEAIPTQWLFNPSLHSRPANQRRPLKRKMGYTWDLANDTYFANRLDDSVGYATAGYRWTYF